MIRAPILILGLFLPVLSGTAVVTSPLLAQVPDSSVAQPAVTSADTVSERVGEQRVSPRGAFIRSSLVPGWGHAKVGAFVRGAFYFSAEAASAFMVFKTQTRIRRTEDRLALRESVITARLQAQGITDPVEIEAALAEDPEFEDLSALRDTRGEQREDWLALGIFLMLIGGADAYVSAHLADFPAAVVLDPTSSGQVEIGLSLPFQF